MPELTDTPVVAPGGFVPRTAVSFGTPGAGAVAVDELHALPVTSGAPAAQSVTIAAATSLSPVIDLAAQRLHRVGVSAGWSTAAISFQSSRDGVSFADLFDRDGEVVLPSAIVGGGARDIIVDPAAFLGIRFLRLRSGTGAIPVAQPDARELTLVTVAR